MAGALTYPEFLAFQARLLQATISLGEASPSVLHSIRALPEWRSGPEDLRPSKLEEIAESYRSLVCWFNPSLGLSVCKLLGLDPREAYEREIRSDHLLPRTTPSPVSSTSKDASKTIEWADRGLMAQQIGAFMVLHGVDVVSGIFHVSSQKLHVGLTTFSHADIAWMAGRISEIREYTRLRFTLADGLLQARWMEPYPEEAHSARKNIQRLLSELFRGVPVVL